MLIEQSFKNVSGDQKFAKKVSRCWPDSLKSTREEVIMDTEMKLEIQVKQVIVQALELEIEPEEIPEDELLLGAGAGEDSIVMLQLVMALETHFAIDVEDDELRAEQFVSARSIAEFVRGKIPATGV